MPCCPHRAIVPRSSAGLTMNWAPASIQARAVCASSTVPAPIITSGSTSALNSSIMRTAPGTVIVISRTEIPPLRMAATARRPISVDSALTTGMMPIAVRRVLTSALSRDFMLPFFLVQRATRGLAPFMTFSTSARVAMVVSPGVLIANAPCAAPHSTAHSGDRPARKP